MFGVLIVHADFGALGWPTSEDLLSNTSYTVFRILLECFALVSVNVFVLISGWFGIKVSLRGLTGLFFQCLFFFFGIYICMILLDRELLSLSGLSKCLMLGENAWFVKAYLGMYILTPVVNAFINVVDRTTFKTVLILFFMFQSIWGWLSDGAGWIMQGYSAFSFVGLYMLARYVRIYSPKLFCGYNGWGMYAILSSITAVFMILGLYANYFPIVNLLFKYTSPLMIAASVYLLLAFTRLKFYNKTVNWVAASCFAVYLCHFIIFPTVMTPLIQNIMVSHDSWGFGLLHIGLLLILFFAVAVLIDKLRMFVWKRFLNRIIPTRYDINIR